MTHLAPTVNLPDIQGQRCGQLRSAAGDTPIMISIGLDDPEAKLRGFGFGADVTMDQPFHREEMVARIQWRHPTVQGACGNRSIRTGRIAGDLDAKDGGGRGATVHLTRLGIPDASNC